RGDAQYGNVARRQPGVATKIEFRTRSHIVTYAVNLNCESCFGTIEIEYVRTDRVLPTKDELIRCTDTEALPESRFRCGQRATKALSHADCFFGALILKPPPPCFAWFPSPASRGRKNDSFRKDSRRFIFLPCITNPSPSKPTFW